MVPLADAQPAPVAAAEGVQSPVAVQADLHSEVGAQAADLTASKPEAANRGGAQAAGIQHCGSC